MNDLQRYLDSGAQRAAALDNRGPLEFDGHGRLKSTIRDSYDSHGFYIFEGVLGDDELLDLRTELDELLKAAPTGPKATKNAAGEPAVGSEFDIPTFRFGRPLSDPFGGTDANNGRHPAKMTEPTPADDAPSFVIYFVYGICQVLASALRLYGHPGLLRVAESINGSDFTPFNDSIWIKEPELGTSVAWHQDGTTHWNHPRWHQDIHGFNFMAQLYPTNPENALWVVPGSHKDGKVDIRKMVADNESDRLPSAVPMVCNAGDVAICNRQALHGSFANTSTERRVSVVFGFHRRDAVLNVETTFGSGKKMLYDEERIYRRSRVIPVAIDARRQKYPAEKPYEYMPLQHEVDKNRYNQQTRNEVLKNYNLYNLGL